MAGQDRKRQVARERYERKRAEYAAKRARQRRRNAVLSAVGAVILIAGFTTWIVVGVGGDDAKPAAAGPTTTASPSPSTSPSPAPTVAPGCTSQPLAIASPQPNFPILPGAAAPELATPPTITVPAGAIPTALKTKDIAVGTGPTVGADDTVTINYAGYNYLNCASFDSSWSKQQYATFALNGGTIEGFAKGIAGMKVGSRREIIIPPSLGYGEAGSPPAIGPNETLVFIVDVVAASPGSSAPAATPGPDATPVPTP